MTYKPLSPSEPDVVIIEAEDVAPAPLPASPRTIERTAQARARELAGVPVGVPAAPRIARGTRDAVSPGEQIRALVFAPQAERAGWIEAELSRAPTSISIQVGRRVRNVIWALVRDPPPRPHVLIVDFDALSPGEVLELHAVRHEGWSGRLIALGNVPSDLCASLDVEQVFCPPLVRDSLLDCVAGTRHAGTTVPIPSHLLAELDITRR